MDVMDDAPSEPRAAPATVGDSSRPYHTKRPHRKSRAGCTNCKKRKVKCDEGRPACRTCLLRKETCFYLEQTASTHAAASNARSKPVAANSSRPPPSHPISRDATTSGADSASDTTSLAVSSPWAVESHAPTPTWQSAVTKHAAPLPVVHEPLYVPGGVRDAMDMRLLWFYSTVGYRSFLTSATAESRVPDILKVTIPAFAFQHTFLMDCILGLSAMHMQCLTPQSDHVLAYRVARYRATAFAGYRKAIETADQSSYPAMIATSLLITALSAQTFREVDANDLYLLDWMIVWRGISLMHHVIDHVGLYKAGIAELFYRPPIDLVRAANYIPNHLLFMCSTIPEEDPEYPYAAVYRDTLRYLGSLYAALRGDDITGSGAGAPELNEVESRNPDLGTFLGLRIITFFTFLDPSFVSMATSRQPRALIIMAHYAMFTKLVHNIWWLRGIGDRDIAGLLKILGPRWSHLLETPKQVLGISDPDEVAKIIIGDPLWVPDGMKRLARTIGDYEDEEARILDSAEMAAPGPPSSLNQGDYKFQSGSSSPPQQTYISHPRTGRGGLSWEDRKGGHTHYDMVDRGPVPAEQDPALSPASSSSHVGLTQSDTLGSGSVASTSPRGDSREDTVALETMVLSSTLAHMEGMGTKYDEDDPWDTGVGVYPSLR